MVTSSRECAATLVRTVTSSPKYTGGAKRTENVPGPRHAPPSDATTGCVIHEYTVTPGTSPPRKPNARASESSWILFSHASDVATALTRYSGSAGPTTTAARPHAPTAAAR